MDVALVVLAIVVAVVAIDALARLDERRRPPDRDPAGSSSQNIVVDLRGRDVDD